MSMNHRIPRPSAQTTGVLSETPVLDRGDAKSRIMAKIRRDMQRTEQPAILAFDKSTSHSRYTSGDFE